MATLANRCRPDFDPSTIKAAESSRVSVQLDNFDSESCCAVVAERGGSKHHVDINWADTGRSILRVFCDCPVSLEGMTCEHIWAAILKLDESGIGRVIPGSGVLGLYHFDDEFDSDVVALDSDDDSFEFEGALFSRVGSDNGKRKAGAPQWERRLSQIRRAASDTSPWESVDQSDAELWYILDLSQSLETDQLSLATYRRFRKKDGNWSKFQKRGVDLYDMDQYPVIDQHICQALQGRRENGYGFFNRWSSSPSEILVDQSLFELLAPKLCSTGRFGWVLDGTLAPEEALPLAWDAGEPWQFKLNVSSDQKKKCWSFEGRMVRDSEELDMRQVVATLKPPLLMLRDRLVQVKGNQFIEWLLILREGPIEVPYDDRNQLLNWLSQQSAMPQVDFPADLKLKEEKGTPQGLFSINAPGAYQARSQMSAKVSFRYGDHDFGLRDHRSAHFEPEEDLMVLRDRDAESELIAQLRAAGAKPATYYAADADVQFSPKEAVSLVQKLVDSGWQVEAEDGVQIRRPGSLRMSVTSDVDWFELEGKVDFGGVSASLPALLAAINDGEKYVRLDDGTKGMLPTEWLEKYRHLAGLSEKSDDSLRFSMSQALLLDAMLAEQDDVDVDKKFDQFRQRLKSFDGVEKQQEPRGFQGELRDYQREGLGWLNFLQEFGLGGCLADDMGLGKTVQVLALLEARRTRGKGKRAERSPSLVVAPKSLVFNWHDEAARFAPKLKVLNYTGQQRKKELEKLGEYDLLITTYGTLRRDIADLKEAKFDYAILDEAQAIKNHNSQAAKATRLLKADHRLLLTGTPVENHLGELWSLFEFANPGMLGRSSAFASLAKNGRKDDQDNESLSMLAQGLRPFLLRRTKKEVLTELPEKTEQTLFCEMPPKQRKQYNELRDYYRTQLSKKVAADGINKSKIHVLEALLRLRQAACHPGLIDKSKEGESSAKIEALLEQLEEVTQEGHKALVFSQFTSLLSIVRKQLDKTKVKYTYLDGRTRKRADKVKEFQENPDCKLFLISLKAGGHGLNLTAADYVYILDPWWNPAVEAQAVDRAHRIGQERPVFAYRLICKDTVEDKILELQKSKRELAEAIVSADNSLIRNLTAEDLQLLLT